MDLEKIEQIKKLAIIAMFSHDTLMEHLVLKGGNAIDLIYRIASRSSLDIDFSMESDLDLLSLSNEIENNLITTFREEGYHVFDVRIARRPNQPKPGTPDFWGGYAIEFKVVPCTMIGESAGNLALLRRRAIEVGLHHGRILNISVSKNEYCAPKQEHDLGGFTIYVYSPEMIVLEKLRSICQQMPEYAVKNSKPTARARDFFDIYVVLDHYERDLLAEENLTLLRNMFRAKEVPLLLLTQVAKYREFHRQDFISVKDTVKPDVKLRAFDFYFDYVLSLTTALSKAIGIV